MYTDDALIQLKKWNVKHFLHSTLAALLMLVDNVLMDKTSYRDLFINILEIHCILLKLAASPGKWLILPMSNKTSVLHLR